MNKKGFTLLELLIAAAIMASLAVFATRAYKNSLAEAHIQDGKTRARAVLVALQRFNIDYPGKTFSGSEMNKLASLGVCAVGGSSLSSGILISCGYLENRTWSDEYISIEVCGAAAGMCKDSTISPRVCMSGRSTNTKIPAKFRYTAAKKAYRFCVSDRQEEEIFPA